MRLSSTTEIVWVGSTHDGERTGYSPSSQHRFHLGLRIPQLAVIAVFLSSMMICALGCDKITSRKEKLLKSSESMLRNQMETITKKCPEGKEGNEWLYECYVPGCKRGLKALQKVRNGQPEITAMMNAGLLMVRKPHGRRGVLRIRFIHPPGYTIVDGVYFVTPDGKEHDFRIVKGHDQINRATWMRHMAFIVAIDNYRFDEIDRKCFKETAIGPIHLSGEVVDAGKLKVGLLMPDGQRSDTVPVCVDYETEEKETEKGSGKTEKSPIERTEKVQ
jgi:hypothetical protein